MWYCLFATDAALHCSFESNVPAKESYILVKEPSIPHYLYNTATSTQMGITLWSWAQHSCKKVLYSCKRHLSSCMIYIITKSDIPVLNTPLSPCDAHIYMYINIHKLTHTQTHTQLYVCIQIYLHIHIYIHPYIYIYMYKYIYICMYMHIYMYIYTNIFSIPWLGTTAPLRRRSTPLCREVGGWGRDPKKCTGRGWGMGSSTI